MDYLDQLLHSKTPFCTHEGGCLLSLLKILMKNLKYGLIISGVLQLIRTLRSGLKDFASFKKSLTPRYLTITLFMCATVVTLRYVRCFLRRIREKDDGINSLVAGAAAGWVASKTLSKEYWYFYLTFIGSRIIGAIHKYLISKGILSEENSYLHSYFMMTVAHLVHSYGYFLHPYILKDDMFGLYQKMSALTHNEKKWHLSTLRYNQRRMVQMFGSQPHYDKITATRIRRLEETIKRQQKQYHP